MKTLIFYDENTGQIYFGLNNNYVVPKDMILKGLEVELLDNQYIKNLDVSIDPPKVNFGTRTSEEEISIQEKINNLQQLITELQNQLVSLQLEVEEGET